MTQPPAGSQPHGPGSAPQPGQTPPAGGPGSVPPPPPMPPQQPGAQPGPYSQPGAPQGQPQGQPPFGSAPMGAPMGPPPGQPGPFGPPHGQPGGPAPAGAGLGGQPYGQPGHPQAYGQPGQQGQLGQPGQPPRGGGRGKPAGGGAPKGVKIAALVLAVILLGGGIGYGLFALLGRGGEDRTVTPDPSATATEDPDSDSTEAAGGGADDTAEPTEDAPSVASDPEERLGQIKDEDAEVIAAEIEGKWVPQLSSKQVGLVAEGMTWDNEDILAEHEQLRDKHPDVLLLWSGDYASFQSGDFWVTIVGKPYSDKEDALRWCTASGYSIENCIAKKISSSGGSDGTTYRG